MYNKQEYKFLVRLFVLMLLISLILFIINLILILWINKSIFLNKMVYLGLSIILFGFEIIRIGIIFISGIIILRFEAINRNYKIIILSILFIAFFFNTLFLIRLFGFACFTPIYSFLCTPFIFISFVLIIIKKHDNNRI